MEPKTAFVCPLSWGLGHATRCIPVVMALQDARVKVILGGNGRSGKLLQDRFPNLQFIEAPFREVKLHRGIPAWASVLAQSPALLLQINRERAFAQQVTIEHKLNFIISDNRYGLRSPKVRSILITHQLRMMHPQPLKLFEGFTEWFIGRLTRRFSEIWVPDYGGEMNLTGKLSHKVSGLQKRVRFIGPLSRLSQKKTDTAILPKKILVIISGPDPARQRFEERVKAEAIKSNRAITIIGGKPERETVDNVGLVTIYSHLNDEAFAREIASAEYVIASGGYSTIMDLVCLGCRATLIPFNGQTEQEYLAERLQNNDQFSMLRLTALNFDTIESWGLSNFRKDLPTTFPTAQHELEDAICDLLGDKENG